MSFSDLDFWRLSDELSVIDVALLSAGHDPGEVRVVGRDPAFAPIESIEHDHQYGPRTYDDQGFRAVFKALRNRILNNEISAIIAYRARLRGTVLVGSDPYDEPPDESELAVDYEILLRVSGDNQRFLFGGADEIETTETIFILREPDWNETRVRVEDVKRWFAERGVSPEFFFPQGKQEGFRQEQNPRYSPKLACAVAAWEAVQQPQPNKSVKQSLEAWITSNGVNYGVGGDDGVVSPTAAAEVAKIANWNPKGGATPTAIETAVEPKEIENFIEQPRKGGGGGFGAGFSTDLDDEIPF